jgi:UDP-3-O-[3-hydroxymyristoyl] glucosamine N-acyltransferase
VVRDGPSSDMAAAPQGYRLRDLVSRFGGELIGDGEVVIRQVAPLDAAGPDSLSFLARADYQHQLLSTRAVAVLLPASHRDATAIARVVCGNPYAYFARVSQLLNPVPVVAPGTDPRAIVHPGAIVPASCQIGPFVVIEDGAVLGERVVVGAHGYIGERTAVGDDSRLNPGVTIYRDCRIGRRALVHSGAVIGADGFGFAQEGGNWIKIPQVGRAVIGDDVEIGANTTVDRGAMADTVIEDGVKLDNQIQVGHNVRIGAHSAIAGCVAIAGSAKIGKHVQIGGSALISGHITITDRVTISGSTVVSKSISRPGRYTGILPFYEHAAWLRAGVHLRQIDDLMRRLKRLEAELRTKVREDDKT